MSEDDKRIRELERAIEERDEEIRRLKAEVSAYKLSLDNALFLLKSREKMEV